MVSTQPLIMKFRRIGTRFTFALPYGGSGKIGGHSNNPGIMRDQDLVSVV